MVELACQARGMKRPSMSDRVEVTPECRPSYFGTEKGIHVFPPGGVGRQARKLLP